FKLVEELIVKRGVKKENIYGMDESGFPPSNQGTQCVVGWRDTKTQQKVGSANHKNVTALKLTIIFKGHNFLEKWGENNWMWLLGVGLANTSSGSFLVIKAHVTHLEMKRAIHPPVLERVSGKIVTPDWSLLDKHAPLLEFTCSALESQCKALERNLLLAQQRLEAQEMIMEGQNAQLVIQNIGMERMNHTLHEKEKGKKSDRTILFPGGKGRHLTDVELIKQKWELEDTKAQEEAEKERSSWGKGEGLTKEAKTSH
ncbi:hypothetical protein BU17DRAFT_54561, partial [Hysterangium stoloniferum]